MKNKLPIIIVTLVICTGLVFFWYYKNHAAIKADNNVIQKSEKANEGADMNYISMSQTDIDTITGIVTAVSEDTEPVSKETKKTVADLFAKYKMTDKDINFFKTVGPGFIWVTHDVFFFTDALESLKTGKPIKSEALQYVEELGLSYKSITPEQIAISDREIENISKNAPALNPPAVMTENDIKSFLNYAKVRAVRVDELFSK